MTEQIESFEVEVSTADDIMRTLARVPPNAKCYTDGGRFLGSALNAIRIVKYDAEDNMVELIT